MTTPNASFTLVKIHDFFLDDTTRDTALSYLVRLDSSDSLVLNELINSEYKDCVHVKPSGGDYYYGCDSEFLSGQQDKINRYKRILPKGTIVEMRGYDTYCTSFGPINHDITVVPYYMTGWTLDTSVVEYDPELSYIHNNRVELDDTSNIEYKLYLDMYNDEHNSYSLSVVKSDDTVKTITINKSITIGDDIYSRLEDLDDLIAHQIQ